MHEKMHKNASPGRLLDAVVVVGSYQSFMFGLAWILLGSAVALTGGCRESPWLPDRAVRCSIGFSVTIAIQADLSSSWP
jgi:hypothetical protein